MDNEDPYMKDPRLGGPSIFLTVLTILVLPFAAGFVLSVNPVLIIAFAPSIWLTIKDRRTHWFVLRYLFMARGTKLSFSCSYSYSYRMAYYESMWDRSAFLENMAPSAKFIAHSYSLLRGTIRATAWFSAADAVAFKLSMMDTLDFKEETV